MFIQIYNKILHLFIILSLGHYQMAVNQPTNQPVKNKTENTEGKKQTTKAFFYLVYIQISSEINKRKDEWEE